MIQTRNMMFTGALAVLALFAANVQASNVAIIVEQQFDNPHCRGSPVVQILSEAEQDVCYTGLDDPAPGSYTNVIDISSGHVVASKVDSYSLTCQRPSFSTGQTCEKTFHKTVGSFCFAI
jgi:hypothetical protein